MQSDYIIKLYEYPAGTCVKVFKWPNFMKSAKYLCAYLHVLVVGFGICVNRVFLNLVLLCVVAGSVA